MPKGLGTFFIIVTFILGVSVGIYSDINKDIAQYENESYIKSNDTIQDVIIKKVQGENNVSGEDDTIQVLATHEKISPYAKMIIKKNFLKCKHISVRIVDVPKEIINLEKDELEEKYQGWNIEKFSSDEIILSRDIDANCEDHFVIKENDGVIAVYKELTEDKLNFIESTNIDIELLTSGDREKFKSGVRVYGKNEVNSIIEDYDS